MDNAFPSPKAQALNETSILFCWAKTIDVELNRYINQLRPLLLQANQHLIGDIVCSYSSLMVHLRPGQVTSLGLVQHLLDDIKRADTTLVNTPTKAITHHNIAVYYGHDAGWDLRYIEQQTGLTTSQIIDYHCAPTYQVFANGFMPGFAYLGVVERPLRLARHSTPRKQVPRGSVAIAELQSAIYPEQSPGGWLILGQTAQPLLNQLNHPATPLLQTGDEVSFYAVDKQDFLRQGGELQLAP